MTIPTFEYLARHAALRDTPKAFLAKIRETNRFFRNERSQVMYEARPGDYVRLDGKLDLQSLLDDEATPLRITGGTDSADCWTQLWYWLNSNKWRLDRLSPEKPWQDGRPKFVNRGRDSA